MTTLAGSVYGHAERSRARRRTSWAVSFWVAVGIWSLAVALLPAAAVVARHDLADLARNLAFGLFLVAGVMSLLCWRLTGDPSTARKAVALLVLGAGMPGAAAIGPLLHEPEILRASAPSTRALFLIPAVALLLPGPRWHRQTSLHPIPVRYLALVGAVVVVSAALLVAVRVELPHQALPVTWRVLGVGAMLAWLLLAFRAAREAVREPRLTVRSPASAYVLLAGAELLRLLVLDGKGAAVGIAPGLQLAASVALVVAAGSELRVAHGGEEELTADLTRELSDLHGRLAAVATAERERLHDARSAVVGVIEASNLLAAPTRGLDTDRLRRLIRAELHRLEAVLETPAAEPVEPFDLAEVLWPVVLVHQLDGSMVHADLPADAGARRVIGRPQATATVLDNLLRNARRHAPGAQVWVRTDVGDARATVTVEDDGPGIPDAERAAVLAPGVRGSTALGVGEGLGLSSCLAAITAQGGSLSVSHRPGGGTRVAFTLATGLPDGRSTPRTIELATRRSSEALAG
jgi:signal transduction histidine kinase